MVVGTLFSALAAEALTALLADEFWPWQWKIQAQRGLSFFTHGGMWGDLLILPPVLYWDVSRYANGWPLWSYPIALLLAIQASTAMHELWAKDPIPDALIGPDRKLTEAGQIHKVWYMPEALTVVFLFYGFTPHPALKDLVITSAAFSFHVFVGTHAFARTFLPWTLPNEKVGRGMGTWRITGGCICGLGLLTIARMHWYW